MKEDHKIEIHKTIPFIIEVLSPLHIGDGNRLLADYDFLIDRGVAYIFDGAEVLTKKMEANPQIEIGQSLDHYLKPAEFADSALYSYQIFSRPREIYCCMKSGGCPYVPGSSLKGSLRTAFLSGIVKKQNIKIDQLNWGPNKQYAATPIERRFFGYNPNEDVFKGLFVRDSELCQSNELIAAQVYSYHASKDAMYEMGQGFRWTVEAFPIGKKIKSELVIDLYALDPPQKSAPFDKPRQDAIKKMKERSPWILRNLFETASAAVFELISNEKAFFELHNMDEIVEFYDNLLNKIKNKSNALVLPLGWGTGWKTKTLGMLDLDKKIIEAITKKYRLGKPGSVEFPMTRRLFMTKDGRCMPMGWVMLTYDQP